MASLSFELSPRSKVRSAEVFIDSPPEPVLEWGNTPRSLPATVEVNPIHSAKKNQMHNDGWYVLCLEWGGAEPRASGKSRVPLHTSCARSIRAQDISKMPKIAFAILISKLQIARTKCKVSKSKDKQVESSEVTQPRRRRRTNITRHFSVVSRPGSSRRRAGGGT